jgi:hypothetical protein
MERSKFYFNTVTGGEGLNNLHLLDVNRQNYNYGNNTDHRQQKAPINEPQPENKTFGLLLREAPGVLKEIRENQPERYKQLYFEEYGQKLNDLD